MPARIQSPNQIPIHTNLSDGRIQALLKELKPFDATQDVLEKANLASKDPEAAGAADIGTAVHIPRIHQVAFESARIEVREINGHLVYYVELLRSISARQFLDEILRPALGPLWDSRTHKVESWLDSDPDRDANKVIGIWIHDLEVDAVNRPYYRDRIPADIAKRLDQA